jgi:hypothetical protein
MCIAQGHAELAMPEDLFDCLQRSAAHDEVTARGMAQIMYLAKASLLSAWWELGVIRVLRV